MYPPRILWHLWITSVYKGIWRIAQLMHEAPHTKRRVLWCIPTTFVSSLGRGIEVVNRGEFYWIVHITCFLTDGKLVSSSSHDRKYAVVEWHFPWSEWIRLQTPNLKKSSFTNTLATVCSIWCRVKTRSPTRFLILAVFPTLKSPLLYTTVVLHISFRQYSYWQVVL